MSICQNCAADIEAHHDEIMALVRSNIFWGKILFLALVEEIVNILNGFLAKVKIRKRINSVGFKPRCPEWYAWQMIQAFTA